MPLEEAGKQLMSGYMERMSTETYSESAMMASNLSLKVKWNEIYLVNFFSLIIETMHKM